MPGNQKGALTVASTLRGEVPELVFREAVYWMHKAVHVLGAAELHVESGLQTWSLSAAYQCAYFAARAILAFFGVSVAELNKISIAVDLCRDMQGVRPQRLSTEGAFGEQIEFRSVGILFDHRQVWQLLQRVLKASSCDVWPTGWCDFLSHADIATITKQRHGLHYHLTYWVVDDLHQFVYTDEFKKVKPQGAGRTLIEPEQSNYSLALGTMMTRMALKLFHDTSRLTNRLANERAAIAAGIGPNRHPVFSELLAQEFPNS